MITLHPPFRKPVRTLDRSARRSRRIRTYSRYAELLHHPKVVIRESLTPLAAAVDAAPILKLCPANWDACIPATVTARADRTLATKNSLDNGVPSLKVKKRPGEEPQIAGNCKNKHRSMCAMFFSLQEPAMSE